MNHLFESFAEKITWSFLTSYSPCAVHCHPLRHFWVWSLHLFFGASTWTIRFYLRMPVIYIRNLELILHPRWEFPERCCTWINCSFELPNSSFVVIAHINHHLKMCVPILKFESKCLCKWTSFSHACLQLNYSGRSFAWQSEWLKFKWDHRSVWLKTTSFFSSRKTMSITVLLSFKCWHPKFFQFLFLFF